MRIMSLAVTALVAGGFGYLGVAAFHDVTAAPAAGSAPSASPSAPSAGGGSRTLLPPGSGGGSIPSAGPGQSVHLMIGGPVTAVSATSVSIGSGSRSVTAAVTRATVVTGNVHAIGGVKVGDQVSAQLSGGAGKLTVVSLQDPASQP